MHIIKLGDRANGDALHRTYEHRVETLSDIRVFVAYLTAQLQKANREGRELYVEAWETYVEAPTALVTKTKGVSF